jgi:hypothetical protein
MSKRFDFWTHGIAAVLELPQLAQLLEHRTDRGTVVEQNANTDTWFHIPLTTPTVMEDDSSIYLRRLGLRAKVNENAQLDRIHVRRGTDLIVDLEVNYIGATIEGTYDVPDQLMSAGSQPGLAMSIHVKFLTGAPRGRIEIQAAGAHYS